MTKKTYVVKTYFQDDNDSCEKYGFPDYFFALIYNTLVPSFCLLLSYTSSNPIIKWGFLVAFVVLAISQFKVRVK